MSSELHLFLARVRAAELREAGRAGDRFAEDPGSGIPVTTPVTLRFAFPDDEYAIARLAQLDSSEPPAMPVLLGEVGGQLRAALSLAGGAVVADPFHPSTALVDLLRARAAQLRGMTPRRRFRRVSGLARILPRLSG
ncbi:MAG TPA: hypothetical protein VGF81_06640 [Solirubrobacteraceae bacterium]|jgi:hypothetical protein